MTTGGDIGSKHWWVCFSVFIALILIALISQFISGISNWKYLSIWLTGAGAIGLLSGYTTGVSKQKGVTGEFMKFISGGILVPLVGGIATLMKEPVNNIERYSYTDNVLTEKITSTTLQSQNTHYDALVILGGFLLVYCFLATIGIYLGVKSQGEKIILNFTE
jgi:hypothetical protein